MWTRVTPRLAALVLSVAATTGPALAQSPGSVPSAPTSPRPAGWDRTAALAPRTAAAPASYWGPSAPVAPKRKPNAVRRVFNRIGNFLGADEEMGTAATYRDPTTGRTLPGTSKPWMNSADK